MCGIALPVYGSLDIMVVCGTLCGVSGLAMSVNVCVGHYYMCGIV